MDKRIGIYLRVSTVGQNTELQRKEIENYLSTRGWLNWIIYEDKLSGTTNQRPALKQMMSDAKEHKLDLIICWKMDRLFRSLKDLVTTLPELSEFGVEFVSIKDQIDMTTASGRLMTHLLAAFAEFEAALIKERVCAGLANAKRNGVVLGRPTVINKTEVARLKEQGLSLSEIAFQINKTKSAVSKTLKKMRIGCVESKVSKTKDFSTPLCTEKSIKIDELTSDIRITGIQ